MTKQRKYQIKMIKLRRCMICGKLATTRNHCRLHADHHNTLTRNRARVKRSIPINAPLYSIYGGKPTKNYLSSLED